MFIDTEGFVERFKKLAEKLLTSEYVKETIDTIVTAMNARENTSMILRHDGPANITLDSYQALDNDDPTHTAMRRYWNIKIPKLPLQNAPGRKERRGALFGKNKPCRKRR